MLIYRSVNVTWIEHMCKLENSNKPRELFELKFKFTFKQSQSKTTGNLFKRCRSF